MILAPIFLTPWAPDAKSRDLAQDISAALDATVDEEGVPLTRKQVAARMKIGTPLLSEWESCARPAHLFRFTSLPDSFWHAFIARIAERRGGYYFTPEVVTLLRGAAALRRQPLMARMTRERKSA